MVKFKLWNSREALYDARSHMHANVQKKSGLKPLRTLLDFT